MDIFAPISDNDKSKRMVAAIDIAASSSEKQCDPAEMPNFSSAAKMFVKKAD